VQPVDAQLGRRVARKSPATPCAWKSATAKTCCASWNWGCWTRRWSISQYWPRLQVEQVLEEKLVLVRLPGRAEPYVYIDWGQDFRRRHDAALPEKAKAALSFNLGPLGLQYILENGGSGYFRTRVVRSYLESGVLEQVPKAPEFSYPTYLVYSRDRDSPTLQRAFDLLREVIQSDEDWSQRWNPLT
jgi:DNA-binding transcriptional LysR family regulator